MKVVRWWQQWLQWRSGLMGSQGWEGRGWREGLSTKKGEEGVGGFTIFDRPLDGKLSLDTRH